MKNFHLSVISFHTYLCELLRHKLLVTDKQQEINKFQISQLMWLKNKFSELLLDTALQKTALQLLTGHIRTCDTKSSLKLQEATVYFICLYYSVLNAVKCKCSISAQLSSNVEWISKALKD